MYCFISIRASYTTFYPQARATARRRVLIKRTSPSPKKRATVEEAGVATDTTKPHCPSGPEPELSRGHPDSTSSVRSGAEGSRRGSDGNMPASVAGM